MTKIYEEVFEEELETSTHKNWLITIPKTVLWADYQKELAIVADRSHVMNYKTQFFPKDMKIGDHCYIVYDGKIRGYMEIVGMIDTPQPWKCTTTGHIWPAGKYIQRSGPFYPVDGPEMQGFRGIRKFKI